MFATSQCFSSTGPRFLRSLLRRSFDVNNYFCTVPKKIIEFDAKATVPLDEFQNFRYKYQDFLPNPNVRSRNPIREKLERRDMLRRRNVISIPEFYVGTIMAVTTSNQHATGKMTRFVGICIWKRAAGLRSQFILRNIVNYQGVEILYHIYSPLIRKIEVLKLEKRLDEDLFYLRDAPNEYSEIPFDMQPEHRDENTKIPINTTKVKINPRPWLQRYERMNLKGVILPELPQKILDEAKKHLKPWEEYDLMDKYRKTTPEEEQRDIFEEICSELKRLETEQKVEKRKRKVERHISATKTIY